MNFKEKINARYNTDAEYRDKKKREANSYYERNKEKIRLKNLEYKKRIIEEKRAYNRSPYIIEFFSISEYQTILINFVLSGQTEKIIDIFYVDTITFKFLYRWLPSHRSGDKSKLKEEYKELKSRFTTEKPILVIMKV